MDTTPMDYRPTGAPSQRCSKCGRRTWHPTAPGQRCGLTQPDGSRCDGRFQAPGEEPVDTGEKRVVLVKPGDLLLIGNIGEMPPENIERMHDWFEQSGIRICVFAADISMDLLSGKD